MSLGKGGFKIDNPDLTIDEYCERIYDFGICLRDYLLTQQARCSWENEDAIGKRFRNFVLNSYQDVIERRSNEFSIEDTTEAHTYSFITFNYTDLIDQLINIAFGGSGKVAKERTVQGSLRRDTIGKIYHVYGSLKDQIIMGVNDEGQIALGRGEKLTAALKWRLVKPEMNRLSNHNWDETAKKIIKGSKIIFIFGVSYGKTDEQWWEVISEWLKKDKSHKLVVFHHDTNVESFKFPWEEIEYEDKGRRKALGSLGIREDDPAYEQILNQIYIIRNTERLNLSSVLGTDIEEEDIAAGRVIWENPTEV